MCCKSIAGFRVQGGTCFFQMKSLPKKRIARLQGVLNDHGYRPKSVVSSSCVKFQRLFFIDWIVFRYLVEFLLEDVGFHWTRFYYLLYTEERHAQLYRSCLHPLPWRRGLKTSCTSVSRWILDRLVVKTEFEWGTCVGLFCWFSERSLEYMFRMETVRNTSYLT